MTAATWARQLAVVGQCVLVVLALAWVLLERPAPIVNVRWREGLSVEARQRAESALQLMKGEPTEDAWQYELASPRSADVAALLQHPSVASTGHIDPGARKVSDDAGRGSVRVWWAGPFRGVRGRKEFRAAFAVVAALTLTCSLMAARSREP